jgi:hypothetical protein
MIIDTCSSGNYFSTQANLPKTKPTLDSIPVQLANQEFMHSTHTAELPIPLLPPAAKAAHLFPALGPTSLISAGQVLDAGGEALFTATDCTFTFQGQEILHGTHSAATNNLWTTTLPTVTPTALTSATPASPAPPIGDAPPLPSGPPRVPSLAQL